RVRLCDGTAWEKFAAMVEAQGGDVSSLKKMRDVHRAPVITEVTAPSAGKLVRLDALEIGRFCVELGAGRAKAGDAVDFAVGVECLKKEADAVDQGEPILRVHSRQPIDLNALSARLLAID
ncbi:MAG: pyrimidine-nucleoside phosphorylase, partial [Chthoniobacterales bacterium]